MNWFSKLQRIDPRIVYVLMFVALSIPLIMPLGIPLSISPLTRPIFDIIEGLDPATDVVLLSLDYSPAAAADIHPQAVVVVDHLTKRGIRWVGVSFWPEGPMMIEQITKALEARGGRYGTDFANLGFKTGGENAIAAFANNPLVITKDFIGNDTANLPIMQGITHIRDFGYVIGFAAGDPGFAAWIRQVVDPMGVKMASGVVTVSVPHAVPFVHSGQLQGLLQGLRGAAEYELLMEAPGRATAMMDAQSMGHLVVIAFILIGNAAYLVTKFVKKD
ncbi:MAG: hypothetical protein DDT37_01034 [Firmicutes bacterium]|nr:hypothetical protein [candidate division NPL-UPA2 bacterium]